MVIMRFAHIYFEKYYTDYYKQNPPYKLKSYLNVLLKYKREGSLLDVGCSYGLFTEIASRYFKCHGMDLNLEIIHRATKNVPHVPFIVGALPCLPFRKLDAIMVFDVLEHIEDLETTMQNLLQSLNTNGLIIAVVPVYDGPLGRTVRRLDNDPTHLHKCSRKFWLDLVSRYFQLLEWKGIFRKLFFGKHYIYFHTFTLRRISPAIIMVLRKN